MTSSSTILMAKYVHTCSHPFTVTSIIYYCQQHLARLADILKAIRVHRKLPWSWGLTIAKCFLTRHCINKTTVQEKQHQHIARRRLAEVYCTSAVAGDLLLWDLVLSWRPAVLTSRLWRDSWWSPDLCSDVACTEDELRGSKTVGFHGTNWQEGEQEAMSKGSSHRHSSASV